MRRAVFFSLVTAKRTCCAGCGSATYAWRKRVSPGTAVKQSFPSSLVWISHDSGMLPKQT